ncbi:hypothetical protein B0H14DRAFT_3056452 [Mycena olivaceomarginata]|nr:hypothetical protein B0H14DRAFT_3056452 [Mycena olivaceomarginata]
MWERRRRLPSMESASAATSLCSVTTANMPTSLGGFSASTGTDCAALSSTRMAPAELRFTADRPALTVHPRAGPVRLVGRGGQGSRPRLLDSGDSHPAAPTMHRGGIGSRPRELPALTRSRLPPLTPPATTLNPSMTQPVLPPGGRGGAGSKSRAAKSSSEAPETVRSSKFPWKGKGKATGNASTYGAPSLTRTDTMDTTSASLVDFLPAHRARQAYQSTMAQDFILEPILRAILALSFVCRLRRRHQDKTRERSHAGPVFLALRLRLLHAIRRTPGTPTKRYADMGIQPTSPASGTIISMIICTAPPPQLPLQSTSISQCRSNLSMIQDLRASLLTV